jgi:hypothetical protein
MFHGMENAFPDAEKRLRICALQTCVQVSSPGAGRDLTEVADG